MMENEKRLIDAKPIVQFIMDGLNNPDKMKALGHDAIEILAEIEFAPTVDAVEVVHGRWEEDKPPKHHIFTGVDVIYRCSECNNRFVHDTRYCPNCGAKMDGGNEDV